VCFNQRSFRATLSTLLVTGSLALTGCGNDSSTVHEVADGYTIDSGLAQKGPLIRGSSVTINSLSTSTLKPSGASYNFETNNNLGAFDPSGTVFTSKVIETTASGYYFNESTAKVSKDIVMLRGISDLITDRAVNVNVLTQIANRRTRQLFTAKAESTFAAARARAQRELLSAFYIYNSADLMPSTGEVRSFSELDLSKARAADQILAAISAQITQVGQDGSGISVLLADLEADLADDGLFNNSGGLAVSPITQLRAVWGSVSWAQIAANLNGFYSNSAYKAGDLSQWVDSSGGADQVIDKYKFSGENAPVGAVSKSPAYVAGPDDVGQCFSVGSVTTGATSGLYYKGSTTAVVGTQKVSLGDSMTIGLSASAGGTFSGFIQRSAPSANGACPNIAPTTGLVRVQKYTFATISVQIIATGFVWPQGISFDNDGNLFVADCTRSDVTDGVYKLSPPISGQSTYTKSIAYKINCPTHAIFDKSNNMYISNAGYPASIIRYTPGGVSSVYASGFNDPQQLIFDPAGNLYFICDWNGRIYRVSSTGVLTTFSDPGVYFGHGLAQDKSGNIYGMGAKSDGTKVLTKVTPSGQKSIITSDWTGYADMVFDDSDNLYLAMGNRITVLSQSGVVSQLNLGFQFKGLQGIAFDNAKRNLFVTDSTNVYKINLR